MILLLQKQVVTVVTVVTFQYFQEITCFKSGYIGGDRW